jgi:hypothetical protein
MNNAERAFLYTSLAVKANEVIVAHQTLAAGYDRGDPLHHLHQAQALEQVRALNWTMNLSRNARASASQEAA